jgi:dipeptidyl-peptidase-4
MEAQDGYMVWVMDNRGTPNRGRAFERATYLKLGQVDLDDQAAAVRQLTRTRPYIDSTRVGITGGSYGGYMSALALLRYPDVFQVGVAESAVTDWRNYDSIYTERYMRLPRENTARAMMLDRRSHMPTACVAICSSCTAMRTTTCTSAT